MPTRFVLLLPLLLLACRSPSSSSSSHDANGEPVKPTASSPPPSSTGSPSSEPSNVGLPADWAALPLKSKTGTMREPGFDDKVENGRVFEVARVPLAPSVKQVMAPAGATILRDAPAGTLFVATAKSIDFKGHPPEPMPLESLRANLGCAWKLEGDTLSIGTFGEWTSKEGGVELNVVVRVPPGVRVGMMRELAGSESVAGRGQGRPLGYWYGRSSPTNGWERITLELDPRHVALGAER